MKICSKCKQTKPISDFHKNHRCKDGHRSDCGTCRCEYQKRYRRTKRGQATQERYYQTEKRKITLRHCRKRYNQTEKYKATKKHYYIRHSERQKAVWTVNNAVAAGRLPCVNTLSCHYCPAQAQQYHHHLGYAPEHWLDVLPACRKCHRKEHKEVA